MGPKLLISKSGIRRPRLSPWIERDKRWPWVVIGFFVVALALVFSISIRRKIDVDEHAFIASGALLARRFLLPYRDYHYNHMPTEVIVYALLFKLCDHLLLAARLFQASCAAMLATVILVVSYRAFDGHPPRRRLLAALGMGLLMASHPLFTRTAGLAWNHDFPMLACVLALLSLRHGLRHARDDASGENMEEARTPVVYGNVARGEGLGEGKAARTPLLRQGGAAGWGKAAAWTAASGFLLGISATSRLTFAPAGLAFLVFLCLYPNVRPRRRIGLLALFALGGVVACLPTIWIWAQSPWNAFFGNFLYPKLNTAYHASREVRRRFTVLPILRYYFINLWLGYPGIGLTAIWFILLMTMKFKLRQVARSAADCELLAILIIVVCLSAAGLMPAPPYPQYFYGPVPFMVLGIALCLARRPWPRRAARAGGDGFTLLQYLEPRQFKVTGWVLAVCVASALPQYRGIIGLPFVSDWTPMRVHAIGVDVARKVRPGKVLTLETTYPLEGGLDVYEVLVTSRFGVRVAPMLSPAQRRQYLMPTVEELDEVFVHDPPVAAMFVLGADTGLDRTLMHDAQAHGYIKIPTLGEGELWVSIRGFPLSSHSLRDVR
ncbi:MAG TPA: hypothetical protein VFC78_13910 [Tepidisphaeraceae bacterium]|nr:hypothetical protein [Tepidisphaeraceae bacterium]